jgi:hypothetical protein
MKHFLIAVLALGAVSVSVLSLARSSAAGSPTRRTLTILYTNNNYGYIEPCG